mmetsp:Transcript_13517/g.47680  ORF Transcript_13517/g.47680 Transcript_13517/m.47680 type:complete len:203 (-) Transcript_13517:2529-3137(-)
MVQCKKANLEEIADVPAELTAIVHDDKIRTGHGHQGDLLVEDVVAGFDGEQAFGVQDDDELLLGLEQGDVEALGAPADMGGEGTAEQVIHQGALAAALHADDADDEQRPAPHVDAKVAVELAHDVADEVGTEERGARELWMPPQRLEGAELQRRRVQEVHWVAVSHPAKIARLAGSKREALVDFGKAWTGADPLHLMPQHQL